MKKSSCERLNKLNEEVFGELVYEFFVNLNKTIGNKWISKVNGKKVCCHP